MEIVLKRIEKNFDHIRETLKNDIKLAKLLFGTVVVTGIVIVVAMLVGIAVQTPITEPQTAYKNEVNVQCQQ